MPLTISIAGTSPPIRPAYEDTTSLPIPPDFIGTLPSIQTSGSTVDYPSTSIDSENVWAEPADIASPSQGWSWNWMEILVLLRLLVQFAITIAILRVYPDMPCDRPISLYLLLYACRIPPAILLSLPRLCIPYSTIGEEVVPPTWRLRLRLIVELFSAGVFFFGNYAVFSSNTCITTAPPIFYTALTWIIIIYCTLTSRILPPILTIIGYILLCLWALAGLPPLPFDPDNRPSSAPISAEIIDLNITRYRARPVPLEDPVEGTDVCEKSEGAPLEMPLGSATRFLCRVWRGVCFRRRPIDPPEALEKGNPDIPFLDTGAEDVCTICMGEYELDQAMGQLRCKHSFHVECILTWIRVRAVCPLCKEALTDASPLSPAILPVLNT